MNATRAEREARAEGAILTTCELLSRLQRQGAPQRDIDALHHSLAALGWWKVRGRTGARRAAILLLRRARHGRQGARTAARGVLAREGVREAPRGAQRAGRRSA